MGFFGRLAGTVGNLFHFGGPSGPVINANGAALETKDSTNTTFAVMRGADPAAAHDFVTLEYMTANPSGGNVFVYQQNGVTAGNVYNTLLGAYNAAAAVRSSRPVIVIDNTLGIPSWTAGTYDLDYMTIRGGTSAFGSGIVFQNGVIFTGTIGFVVDALQLIWNSTTAPVMTVSSGFVQVSFVNGSFISNGGLATQHFFHVLSGGGLTVPGGGYFASGAIAAVSVDLGGSFILDLNDDYAQLQGNVLTGPGTIDVVINNTTIPVSKVQTGAPNVTYSYPVGSDLTWQGARQELVTAIQGIKTPAGSTAALGDVLVVSETPLWVTPVDVAFDGTSLLYVADQGAVAGIVNLWYVDQTTTPYNAASATPFPSTVTANNRVVHVTYSGVDYILCACSSTGTDNLYVWDATNFNLAGVGQFPSSGAVATGVAMDAAGDVFTVDATNGLQKFNLPAMLAAYPAAVAPTATVAIASALDVTYDGTDIYVSDGNQHHVFQYTTVPALVATYTDGPARAMGSLFWAPGIAGIASVWVATNVGGNYLRIGTAAMTLANTIATAAAGQLGRAAFDGTFLYVSDPTTGNIELINPATNISTAQYLSTAPNASHMGGGDYSTFDSRVWAAMLTTPTGGQGISSFISTGAVGYFIGPFGLVYKPITVPSTGTATTTGNSTSALLSIPLLTNTAAILSLSAIGQNGTYAYAFDATTPADTFGGVYHQPPLPLYGGQQSAFPIAPNVSGTWSGSALNITVTGPQASVIATADNGAGGIRITLSKAVLTSVLTGLSVTISGIVGTVEANGPHIATYVSSNQFDIPVPFVNPWISGGLVVLTAPETIQWSGSGSLDLKSP